MSHLTDTHSHLNYQFYENDLESVIQRAWDNDLSKILIPGIDIQTSQEAVQYCHSVPGLYAAIGIHPNSSTTWIDDTIKELRNLAQDPKVVAIGEIGLDYYRKHAPHDLQMTVFKKQLELAAELGKPVIIHNRNAFHDLWPCLVSWREELKSSGSQLAHRPGVLHAFSEDLDAGRDVIDKHFFIGICGTITYKNAKRRQEITAQLSLDSLLLETDAPFLTPHPHRGRRNEPSFIAHTAEQLAYLHNQSIAVIKEMTSANANKLFRWEAPN